MTVLESCLDPDCAPDLGSCCRLTQDIWLGVTRLDWVVDRFFYPDSSVGNTLTFGVYMVTLGYVLALVFRSHAAVPRRR